MPPQSFEPWGRITQIHPTHRLKSRGGSLMFQTETLGGHPRVEEGHHHAPQGHPQEAVEVAEAGEGGGGGGAPPPPPPDPPPPSKLKIFKGPPPPYLQETGRR